MVFRVVDGHHHLGKSKSGRRLMGDQEQPPRRLRRSAKTRAQSDVSIGISSRVKIMAKT